MKAQRILLVALCIAGVAVSPILLFAQEMPAARCYEYVTIRWAGRDCPHLIRPGGKVEHIGHELRTLSKPSGTDDRCFYLNAAMNSLSKEGFELAGMASDDLIMKRGVGR